MKPVSIVRNTMKPAVLVAALLGLSALAGCLGSAGEDDLSRNLAPEAILEVDRPERWSGETFTFNASASSDADGNITSYVFDFGDGTVVEVDDAENASAVEHAYANGGVYSVTLTVTDDGANNTGQATASTALVVVVQERQQIPTQVNYAAPMSDANASKSAHVFTAYEEVRAYEADLNVRGMLPVGSSEISIRVLDTEGEVLEEQNLTVHGTGNETVRLKGVLSAAGDYTIEMFVKSGGASIGGELRVYYDNATATA